LSAQPAPPAPPLVVAVVGAGPGGVGVLERLVANAALLPGPPVEVVLVDPYPPGGGRVWRHDQSPLLRMNSLAADVTVFTDDSVRMAGPVRPGPTLDQWADLVTRGEIADHDVRDPDLLTQLAAVRPGTFASRQVHSAYMSWFFRRTVRGAPPSWTVRTLEQYVRNLTDGPDGRQRLWLADGTALAADVVVIAFGHLDARPHGEDRAMAAFADRHGLFHLPPAYSADADLAGIAPGQDVLLRGLGLAFVDVVVLLTEGRGGRYEREPGRGLRYVPSGAEPVLHAGSRRGVPYHSKLDYLLDERPPLPRFFGPDQVEELLTRAPLDFRTDVWPLIAKEVGFGYYHELCRAHPGRVRDPDFLDRYAALPPDDLAGMARLVRQAVPAAADRLDLARLDRPLAGRRFADAEHFQEFMRGYLAADRARAADPAYSADHGAFYALLSVYAQLPRLLGADAFTPASRLAEVERWWHGYFSYLASGPPGFRLDELLALSRAGILRFVGPDMWVAPDERGVFRSGSPSVPGEVTATALVEARLPEATVRHSGSELLRALVACGAAVEEVLTDSTDGSRHPSGRLLVTPDRNLVDAAGRPHPDRYAIGHPTSRRAAAAFARPRTNAIAFRQNDALARVVLTRLAATHASPDAAELRSA
jgi:FAD-NAD(P)-binding